MVEAAVERWGSLEILVSNAGAGTRFGITETTDEEAAERGRVVNTVNQIEYVNSRLEDLFDRLGYGVDDVGSRTQAGLRYQLVGVHQADLQQF